MSITRRRFLVSGVLLAGAAPLGRLLAQARFDRDPFTLGVASGYPTADGVVLWTRLAPDPLAGGGMPPGPVEVGWEIGTDAAFRNIVQRGKGPAVAEWAHSVHAEVMGLAPGREYFYRFHAGSATSPVGRTRTAPTEAGNRLRFALASCQQYEQGWFSAYRHMSEEDLDLVVHVGDYIYESSWGRNHVRKHGTPEPTTLEAYRNRYALYKGDADLKGAHAAFPWIVTWDDHEVQNDYANDRSQFLEPAETFLERRTAAYRAYYEHMPLPAAMRPNGREMRIYTRVAYGSFVNLHVLDDRQYRSHQVCPREGRGGGNIVPAEACPDLQDPSRTLLGATQERWLEDGLAASRARWNVIAQQTLMAQLDRKPGEGQVFWTDGWDGYPKARERLLSAIAGRRVANPIVIGGDVHMSAAADLRVNFDDPGSPVVATEFVGTSITSQGPTAKQTETWRAENPHVHFMNGTQRGYTTIELTPRQATARMRVIGSLADPATGVRTLAAWTVEDGKPGVQRGG